MRQTIQKMAYLNDYIPSPVFERNPDRQMHKHRRNKQGWDILDDSERQDSWGIFWCDTAQHYWA